MYFALHPHGQSMRGRWVANNGDGKILTGWSGMGRSESEARTMIDELKSLEHAAQSPGGHPSVVLARF
jgi:hypothetical protein